MAERMLVFALCFAGGAADAAAPMSYAERLSTHRQIGGQHVGSCSQSLILRGGSGLSLDLKARLESLVKSAPVMLFMKGSPTKPQCGFSRQMVALLQQKGIEFQSFDIFQDEEVRQSLKIYSDWPTYPQLYANGKLVGGLDVVAELINSGEFERELLGTLQESKEGTPLAPVPLSGAGNAKITAAHLEAKIRKALNATIVEVEDTSDGCGAKFAALVVAPAFDGMPLIERQRTVHAAIEHEMKQIHALSLKCLTPKQHQS